jgi:hypothetical protein
MITDVMVDPPEADWWNVLGITARSGANLPALVDATDAALCQRINSQIADSPIYAFWAGRYVVATTMPPTDRIEHGVTHFWVIDSTGEVIHSYGDRRVPTPQDLHATSTVGGNIALQWTSPGTYITSYQLQRAVGSGAFAILGGTLPGSATSATDASALIGTAYRYRLLAKVVNPQGVYTGYTNAVSLTATPPNIGTVARTTTGLLFRDDFNRPNEQLVGAGKNWTRMGGPSVDADWQVQGNQAKVLSAGASARQAEAYPQGVTPQSGDVVVQSWFQCGNTAGRTGVTLVQAGEAGGILFIRDPYDGWELWNYGSGFYTNPANNAASVRESGVLKLRRKSGRYQAWVDGILIFDIASDARLNTVAFYPALIQLQQPATWDDFSVYAGNTVTITGLPAGYKLRVGGALSAAAVSAQPTTVDVGGVSFPVAQIEILDASGTLVKVYAPTDGVWGGDVYSLNGTP